MKNFEDWRHLKEKINKSPADFFFYEREIFFAHLGANVGFEQDGKGASFERPVVILKKFNAYCGLIVPLTNQKREGKYYFPFQIPSEEKPSYAILSQIRLLDRRRFINKIGMLDSKTFETLKKAIREVTLQ